MKNKNSWEMTARESLFNKQERKDRWQLYQENNPDDLDSINSFLCNCGKRHSWAEVGRKH